MRSSRMKDQIIMVVIDPSNTASAIGSGEEVLLRKVESAPLVTASFERLASTNSRTLLCAGTSYLTTPTADPQEWMPYQMSNNSSKNPVEKLRQLRRWLIRRWLQIFNLRTSQPAFSLEELLMYRATLHQASQGSLPSTTPSSPSMTS